MAYIDGYGYELDAQKTGVNMYRSNMTAVDQWNDEDGRHWSPSPPDGPFSKGRRTEKTGAS